MRPQQCIVEWIEYLQDEQKRRWIAHCERMAEATYALADWCEEPDMLAAYVALGARWVRMAELGPPPHTHRHQDHGDPGS